jgi:hypothetical protein
MTDGAQIVSKAQLAFSKIGYQNSHQLPSLTAPKGLSNAQAQTWHDKQAAAHELMVSGTLRSVADKRLKKAKETCETLDMTTGVSKVAVGTAAELFHGAVVTITAQVNNPASRVDMAKLRNELAKSGMSLAAIEKLMLKCSVKNKPSVIITAQPVAAA